MSADEVTAMQNSKNDIYLVFHYMGHKWTVKIRDKKVLADLINDDGSLDLLKFISTKYMKYIVKIERVTA